MEEVKSITTKNNVIIYNENHERGYMNKKGITEIELSNGKKFILDNQSSADISQSEYLKVIPTKRTKSKEVFKNLMYDTERLQRLARGDGKRKLFN